MKKIFVLLILMSSVTLFGQKTFGSLDKLIKHYSKIEGVVYDAKKEMPLPLPFIERLDGVESLIVEECSEQDVQDFVNVDMTAFKDYEVAFRVVDAEDKVTVLLKPIKKSDVEKFSELIFVVQEKSEGVLFRLKGVFTKPDPSMLDGLNM